MSCTRSSGGIQRRSSASSTTPPATLADQTAARILQHPEAFEQLLLVPLEKVARDSRAADTFTSAMVQKRTLVANIITDRPQALVPITDSMLRSGARKPSARAGLRTAMSEAADPQATKSAPPTCLRRHVACTLERYGYIRNG